MFRPSPTLTFAAASALALALLLPSLAAAQDSGGPLWGWLPFPLAFGGPANSGPTADPNGLDTGDRNGGMDPNSAQGDGERGGSMDPDGAQGGGGQPPTDSFSADVDPNG